MPHTATPAAINPGIRFNIEVDLPYILLWLISDLNITLRFSGLDASSWGCRQKIFAPWFLVRLRSGCLHSQGVVDLFPVDLAQQFLDTVFRAKDPDFYILNERRISLVNKEIPINVIDLFPSATLAIAEKQNVRDAMAERIVAVFMHKGCARDLGVNFGIGAGDHGDHQHVEVHLHLEMQKVFHLRALKVYLCRVLLGSHFLEPAKNQRLIAF